MRYARLFLLGGLVLSGLAEMRAAEPAPSYAKQVRPFLVKYCQECHSGPADDAKGGLSLESFKSLMETGNHGPVVVPGKPDASRLVLMAEGTQKPKMPPSKAAKQPKPSEVGILRAWVAAGAKDDSATGVAALPDIKPRTLLPPPVTALAYRPDGKYLAAAYGTKVDLLDVATGELVPLFNSVTKITALTWSRDGKYQAIAYGKAGMPGNEFRVHRFTPDWAPAKGGPDSVFAVRAHSDVIFALAFSPDAKLVATCSYDRLIKLWDLATGNEVRTLKDHSDAVYGLAFSPDGKLLASAAADRAVKVWDVATGRRLYTLSEPTDWVYAVAWHPNGKHLAAAGIDKSIRVWEVDVNGGKLVHSVFAHEGPVTRLVYANDGKTLYSLGEDRVVKSWDAVRMVEKKVYAKQPETVLSIAVRPDQKQLALGRYDGVAVLLDEASGKVQSEPLPVKPKPPQVTKVSPAFGRRGETVRVILEGKGLDTATEFVANPVGISGKLLADARSATSLQAEVAIPATLPAGVYQLSLKNDAGASAGLPFVVDWFAAVPEKEANNAFRDGQALALSSTIAGTLDKAGDIDFYRFDAKAGQQIGVQLVHAAGAKLEAVLELTDATGRVLDEGRDGLLGHTVAQPGTFALCIRDREYRGEGGMQYRLNVGDLPVVTGVFPLGLQRGTETDIKVSGANLGGVNTVKVKAPDDAVVGSTLPIVVQTSAGPALGKATVVVGEFPEATLAGDGTSASIDNNLPRLPVPGTGNGRLNHGGAADGWRFTAKKGERLIIEVNARRLGSPIDSYVEVLDMKGQPVPRAVLRCLAKTYVTFRDHDAAGANIRLEAWSELAVNDYLYVGSELLRIKALPTHPDADAFFFSAGGQRTGYLDTTPTYLSNGTPMYKVEIHPPGSSFPPNGFPVFTINYRNDDGGPGYGKDSRLFFDPPADGEYLVRVGDSRGVSSSPRPSGEEGGVRGAYRLTIRPPRPDFSVSFTPTNPAVWKGGALPITVNADRVDGFDGAIELTLENLPPGFSAPATAIPAGETSTSFALFADKSAQVPADAPSLKLTAKANVNGKPIRHEVAGAKATAVDPGEIVTTTAQSEVTVRPGGETRLTVTIERKSGFTGRVPIEVKGMPHGVRVLDIGLNGILITEKETTRTMVFYAEPWVEPTEHPIVILAKREGKNTEHAAKSVLLKVAANK